MSSRQTAALPRRKRFARSVLFCIDISTSWSKHGDIATYFLIQHRYLDTAWPLKMKSWSIDASTRERRIARVLEVSVMIKFCVISGSRCFDMNPGPAPMSSTEGNRRLISCPRQRKQRSDRSKAYTPSVCRGFLTARPHTACTIPSVSTEPRLSSSAPNVCRIEVEQETERYISIYHWL